MLPTAYVVLRVLPVRRIVPKLNGYHQMLPYILPSPVTKQWHQKPSGMEKRHLNLTIEVFLP